MRSSRCGVTALAGLVAAAAALVGVRGTTSAAVATAQYVLERTSSGPTSVELSIGFSEWGKPVFVGIIGASVTGGQVTAVSPVAATVANQRPDPVVRADGTQVDGCGAGECSVSFAAATVDAFSYADDGGPGGLDRFYIVVEGDNPIIRETQGDWSLVAAALTYGYVDGLHSSDVSAYAEQSGVEVFREAQLGGGATGSLAEGEPPCSGGGPGGGIPVQAGAGQVQLTGGMTTPSVTCPGIASSYVASWATGTTQWTLHGTAVGNATLEEVRLFVVDLPVSGAGSLTG